MSSISPGRKPIDSPASTAGRACALGAAGSVTACRRRGPRRRAGARRGGADRRGAGSDARAASRGVQARERGGADGGSGGEGTARRDYGGCITRPVDGTPSTDESAIVIATWLRGTTSSGRWRAYPMRMAACVDPRTVQRTSRRRSSAGPQANARATAVARSSACRRAADAGPGTR